MNPKHRNVYRHKDKGYKITAVLTNKGFYQTDIGLLSEEAFHEKYEFVEKYKKVKEANGI